MQGPKKNNRKLPEINITPLVDVMLVLLVIFMAVSPALHSDIDVKVPKIQYTTDGKGKTKKDLIKIVIGKNKLFINEKEITEASLFNEISQYPKDMAILVKADKDLSYDAVFNILAILGAANYSNLNLVGVCEG